jgi:chitodextrinase
LEVLLTAQGSDPDGDVLTYRWDFGDGSAPASGRTARHTYARNGVYEATVTATDRSGATGTDTVEITVGNPGGGQPPTVQVAADRTTGAAPLRVNFSAAGSDPDGDAIMYTWAFGDGGTAGGQRPTHTYTAPGTYTATVTVTDAGGQTGTASVTITVTGALQIAGAQQEQSAAAAGGALRMLSQPSLGSFRKRGLKVAATCAADGDAAVGLWASRKAARSLGLRSRGLGRKRFACAAGKTVQVRLKPSRKVRRALRSERPASLRVTVALAMRDGAPLKRTLKLER